MTSSLRATQTCAASAGSRRRVMMSGRGRHQHRIGPAARPSPWRQGRGLGAPALRVGGTSMSAPLWMRPLLRPARRRPPRSLNKASVRSAGDRAERPAVSSSVSPGKVHSNLLEAEHQATAAWRRAGAPTHPQVCAAGRVAFTITPVSIVRPHENSNTFVSEPVRVIPHLPSGQDQELVCPVSRSTTRSPSRGSRRKEGSSSFRRATDLLNPPEGAHQIATDREPRNSFLAQHSNVVRRIVSGNRLPCNP